MGIKDLWPLLEPFAERKPMSELGGKTVAIDLAGWVCESLNVVDYSVHSHQHLKNLFFRTCYLIWEEVTPVFILEGEAPQLKAQVIAKRNEQQFRGAKPREMSQYTHKETKGGRTRFNHVLRQCENLLSCMGVACVKAPGEAEAYAAFLNKKNLVDGVISQDSDCFAYGATCVYRNFSASMQGAQAASGGAVDIYDMRVISSKMDFGQNKIIVMALLCGCDYCPDGIGGVGRESVNKLFNKYKEHEILKRVRIWRQEDSKYTSLEMRVNDKSICSNCGHMGRTARHTTNGCGMCRTTRGCDDSLWREERLSLKAELMLRKKALSDEKFPNENVIAEFLNEPTTLPTLSLSWQQPNLVKFIKQTSRFLQWSEIYCFQKFLPLMTRWHLQNNYLIQQTPQLACVEPKQIVKKRNLKAVLSLEIIWQDVDNCLEGLIPVEQILKYREEHNNDTSFLWTTVEPWNLVEYAYPQLLEEFIRSKEKSKPIKSTKTTKMTKTTKITKTTKSGHNINVEGTKKFGLIDRFLIKSREHSTPIKKKSTPPASPLALNLNDLADGSGVFDMSDLIDAIVQPKDQIVKSLEEHDGMKLYYEQISKDVNRQKMMMDDLDILVAQKRQIMTPTKTTTNETKKNKLNISLDDSFDVLVNQKNYRLQELMERAKLLKAIQPTN